MKVHHIPFQKTGYFSNIICDYLDKNSNLTKFYGNYPDLDGFKKQIELRSASELDSEQQRKNLVAILNRQYNSFNCSELTSKNIQSLEAKNTFTITTGHQLNIFTGPLYFLYKIIATINLTNTLKKEYPTFNFVPVYWMATEDHDFEEINFFNLKNRKIAWNRQSSGAVGRLSTKGFDKVFDEFSTLVGTTRNATFLKELFENTYLNHSNLTDATRYLVNELFSEYGLVIIDGDARQLKEQFIPILKDELLNKTSFQEVSKTNKQLNKDYTIQVNPREINLFYLKDNLRERIIFENNMYKINNTTITFF